MKKLILAILTVSLVVWIALSVAATPVTLEWSPNTEPDLMGYRIFMRDSGGSYDYNNPNWEGIETTCTISAPDDVVFFVARAFDNEGYESGDSNEVCFDPLNPNPGTPPATVKGLRLVLM